MELVDLPIEILWEIGTYVETTNFHNILATNKVWNKCFGGNKFWKSLFERDLSKFYELNEEQVQRGDDLDFKQLYQSITSKKPVREKVNIKTIGDRLTGKGSVSFMNPFQHDGSNKVKNYQKDELFKSCGVCGRKNTVLFSHVLIESPYYEHWVAKCLDCHMIMELVDQVSSGFW